MKELILECEQITKDINNLINYQNLVFNEGIDFKKIKDIIIAKIKQFIEKLKEIKNKIIKLVSMKKMGNRDDLHHKNDFKTVTVHLQLIYDYSEIINNISSEINMIGTLHDVSIFIGGYERYTEEEYVKTVKVDDKLKKLAATNINRCKKDLEIFNKEIEKCKVLLNEMKKDLGSDDYTKINKALLNLNNLTRVTTKIITVTLIESKQILGA